MNEPIKNHPILTLYPEVDRKMFNLLLYSQTPGVIKAMKKEVALFEAVLKK
jgi:hypothetical protein